MLYKHETHFRMNPSISKPRLAAEWRISIHSYTEIYEIKNNIFAKHDELFFENKNNLNIRITVESRPTQLLLIPLIMKNRLCPLWHFKSIFQLNTWIVFSTFLYTSIFTNFFFLYSSFRLSNSVPISTICPNGSPSTRIGPRPADHRWRNTNTHALVQPNSCVISQASTRRHSSGCASFNAVVYYLHCGLWLIIAWNDVCHEFETNIHMINIYTKYRKLS